MDQSNEPILEQYENLDISEYSAVNPKIKVKSILFSGLKRTQKDFLLKTLKDTELSESRDLLELSTNLTAAFGKLERLNVFKDVSVTIDEAEKEQDSSSTSSDAHNVKITFNCQEKRFNVRTGTELQRKDIAWVKKCRNSVYFRLFLLRIFAGVSLIYLVELKV